MVIQGTLKWEEYPLNNVRVPVVSPVIVGNTIYANVGFAAKKKSLYRISLDMGEWTPLSGIAHRMRHTNFLVDDKIYLVGGRRYLTSKPRIETYNILTEEVQSFKPFIAIYQTSAYVDTRREIVIVGYDSRANKMKVASFNVNDKQLTPYESSGEPPPPVSSAGNIVAHGERLFYLYKPIGHTECALSVLKLGRRLKGTWATIGLRGTALPNTRFHTFEGVSGLLLIFGGSTNTLEVPQDFLLIDPRTYEAERVGPGRKSSFEYRGSWPSRPVEGDSVAWNGKLWIFAGRGIYKLELKRS